MHIYFNLHKRSWSILNPKTGLVVNKDRPVTCLILEDVTFKVREGSRQRVIREKRKNAHAFAVGTIRVQPHDTSGCTVPVSYNPYKAGHFVRLDTGEPVYHAAMLLMGTAQRDGKRVPVVLAKL